jgi:thioredoxin reductase
MQYHDYIIIGAGPGGLQMGYFLEKARRDYLILEANDGAGSFFATQPRHRTLLSINKRFNVFPEPDFNMRHDWNSLLTNDRSLLFRDYSDALYPHADDLYRYLQDFADKYALQIRYDTRIRSIERDGNGSSNFLLHDTQGGQFACAHLLIATGATHPYLPDDIDGIELAEGYEEHDIDPKRFENKRVLIIGRGNSAFEVANHLAGYAGQIVLAVGNRPPRHAWQTHYVGDVRAINNTILDMYQLKSLHSTLGFWVKKIVKQADGTFLVNIENDVPHWQTPGTVKLQFIYDHVIRCTGWKYAAAELFAPGAGPEVDSKGKYPVLSSCWESSVPNAFFIGTAMAARDRRAASGFIHGFRYNIRTLFRLLEERYEGNPLPREEFALRTVDDLHTFADHLIQRLSTTDALYQMNGFMGDILVFTPGKVTVFYELPVDYALERSDLIAHTETLILTLEYGFNNFPGNPNTLDFISIPDEESDERCAAFLHGVFRHYKDGNLVAEMHLPESIFIRYGPFRGDSDGGQLMEDVHKNRIMNLINRVVRVTSTTFSEQVTRPGTFVPWPEGQSLEKPRIPQCFASVTPSRTAD